MLANFLHRVLDESADVAQRPAMDVAETDNGYTLSFDLPGMAKEQVKVSIDGRAVSVEASPAEEAATDASRVIYRERRVPRFARTVTLPTEVDHASSQARFENGTRRREDPHDPVSPASGQRGRTPKAPSRRTCATPRCKRSAAASAIIAPLSVHSATSG